MLFVEFEVAEGLVNGARGVVLRFVNTLPLVKVNKFSATCVLFFVFYFVLVFVCFLFRCRWLYVRSRCKQHLTLCSLQFTNGVERVIGPETWKIELAGVVVAVRCLLLCVVFVLFIIVRLFCVPHLHFRSVTVRCVIDMYYCVCI